MKKLLRTYMVFRDEWEAVASFSILDASNYASIWTGMTVGVNWFREKVSDPLCVYLHGR